MRCINMQANVLQLIVFPNMQNKEGGIIIQQEENEHVKNIKKHF